MAKYAYHQTDANEGRLVAYLKAHGVSVCKIGRPVDLLLAMHTGVTVVAEVKTARGRLRASQQAFLASWPGRWAILRTEADCDALIRSMHALWQPARRQGAV